MKPRIFIIGFGPGSPSLMTGYAADILSSCGMVYSSERIAGLYKNIKPPVKAVSVEEMAAMKPEDGRTAFLVSGDSGFYSAAKKLAASFGVDACVEIVPGISSIQYFCAKIGESWDNGRILSLHGRGGSLLGPVSYNGKVFALTGGSRKAADILAELDKAGLGSLRAAAGENLSMESERIMEGSVSELASETFSNLTVLAVFNPAFIEICRSYRDDEFIRGRVPMTKEEVRVLSAAKMKIKPNHIVWDVGAGTGSVSAELSGRAWDGLVYAVERSGEGAELIGKNILRLGCYNVIPVKGEAPECLWGLPAPDRVFIGGSSGRLKDIADLVFKMNPNALLTVNAVTLETLGEAAAILKDAEIVCVNSARAEKIGGYNMMKANNPVYIITGGLNA